MNQFHRCSEDESAATRLDLIHNIWNICEWPHSWAAMVHELLQLPDISSLFIYDVMLLKTTELVARQQSDTNRPADADSWTMTCICHQTSQNLYVIVDTVSRPWPNTYNLAIGLAFYCFSARFFPTLSFYFWSIQMLKSAL